MTAATATVDIDAIVKSTLAELTDRPLAQIEDTHQLWGDLHFDSLDLVELEMLLDEALPGLVEAGVDLFERLDRRVTVGRLVAHVGRVCADIDAAARSARVREVQP